MIKKIVRENEAVKSYILDASFGGKPGQFVNVWLPGVDEKPMSIADDDGNQMMLTICEVGAFSKAIAALKVGDRIGIRGPYGKPFSWKPNQHLVMVAGGYGAAPLYFVSKIAMTQECTVDFILGARTKDQLLYLSRLKKLNHGTFQNLKLYISTDDGSSGHKGYNVDILADILGEVSMENGKMGHEKNRIHFKQRGSDDGKSFWKSKKKPDWVFTCGPEKMMKRVSDICFQLKVPAQISVERFMKCGFGVCGQCCVDDKGFPVCTEGPVMENSKVRTIKEFGLYHRDCEGRKVFF
ncbi:dihydroorotate dehydrogenase electron transfer subunit [Candidatus Peregrinibacteria bacterium]|nr:dihydroorotate dehydrogenase electron transfer subunit [Candidatus Peregrinibacteria bacterium]